MMSSMRSSKASSSVLRRPTASKSLYMSTQRLIFNIPPSFAQSGSPTSRPTNRTYLVLLGLEDLGLFLARMTFAGAQCQG